MEASSRRMGVSKSKMGRIINSEGAKAFNQARSMQAEINRGIKSAQKARDKNASASKRAQEKASGQKLAF